MKISIRYKSFSTIQKNLDEEQICDYLEQFNGVKNIKGIDIRDDCVMVLTDDPNFQLGCFSVLPSPDIKDYDVCLVEFRSLTLIPLERRRHPLSFENEAKYTTLPVKILRSDPKGKVVKTFKPYQMNIGFGPTVEQRYYLLSDDGSFGVYFQDLLCGFETYLLKGHVDPPVFGNRQLKWKNAEVDKCQICWKIDFLLC